MRGVSSPGVSIIGPLPSSKCNQTHFGRMKIRKRFFPLPFFCKTNKKRGRGKLPLPLASSLFSLFLTGPNSNRFNRQELAPNPHGRSLVWLYIDMYISLMCFKHPTLHVLIQTCILCHVPHYVHVRMCIYTYKPKGFSILEFSSMS